MAFEPADDPSDPVQHGRELSDPVALARVDRQLGLDAVLQQRLVELPGLAGGRASVHAARSEERRCLHPMGEGDGAAGEILAARVGQVVPQDEPIPVADVAGEVLAVPVRHRRQRHRGGEAIRLGHQPGRHEPAVASTDHAQPVRVGRAPFDQRV